MSRDLASAILTALAAGKLVRAWLVELALDEPTGTLRVTNYFRDIEWGGNTYTKSGHLLSISGIEETSALMVNEVTITYSGVDQAMTALLLQEYYLDRDVAIHRAYMDPDTYELVGVEPLFKGRVNRPVINEDHEKKTSTVELQVANSWVDFERTPGRLTNHEQQQLHFPGDKGFEYAGDIFKKLPWGREE